MKFSGSVGMFEGRLPQGGGIADKTFPLVRTGTESGMIDVRGVEARVKRPPPTTRPVTTRTRVMWTERGAVLRVLVATNLFNELQEMWMPEGGLLGRVRAQADLAGSVSMAARRPPRPSPPVPTILRAVFADEGGMLDIELPDEVVTDLDDLGGSEEIVVQLLQDDEPQT